MKRLPWSGVPAPAAVDRPTFKGCGKRLRPRVEHVWEASAWPVARKWAGKFEDYDGFHSMRCALEFARRAHASGFRTKGAPGV